MSIRVLVVDDSAFMRKMISGMIDAEPGLEVVGTARDGAAGVEKTTRLQPDLITLDIEMPVMSGMEALRKIVHLPDLQHKPSILMCSSLTVDGSREAFHALKIGASDFIAKDPQVFGQNDETFRHELIHKIKAIARPRPIASKTNDPLTARTVLGTHPKVTAPPIDRKLIEGLYPQCVVIGSSTGGPPVVETLVCALPERCAFPVLVAQHMPALFSRSLAARLDAMASVEVRIAEHGGVLQPGVVYIGEGGNHLRLRQAGSSMRLEVSPRPEDAIYKPSVDELFTSAATSFGERVLGFMLTGMGHDGAEGSRLIQAAGGKVLTQEASSCVVYGMPRAVVDAGLSSGAGTPRELASVLTTIGGSSTNACKRSA